MKKGLFLALSFCLAYAAQAQTVNSFISKGNEYYKQTQFSLAEAEYRKALQASPENTTAQYNLANALQKQKKYDEATQVLEKLYGSASEKMLKSATAYNQGVAYTKQRSLEASIEAYKKALRLNPDDKEARENLQKALAELKKQQNDQEQQQKSKSNMSQREAEQKLNLLQEKEKELQQRLQNQNRQKGGKQSKDW